MLRSPLASVWTTVLGGVLSCLFVLFATPAMADLITVPSDQPTIQAAIDAAVDGDEVRVLPGNYRERLNLLGKKIRIYGSIPNPNLNFISQPDGGSGRLVTCTSGEDENTIIENFTIRNGVSGGMAISNASPVIRNCRFLENTGVSEGGAIRIDGTSTPRIEDCEFSDNAASGGTNIRGGAIYMTGAGVDVTIVDCAFNRNLSRANQTESRADGGAICLRSGSRLEVTDCTFDSNLVSAQSDSYCSSQNAYAIGGAIQAETDTAVVVDGCQFSGNEAHGDIYDNYACNARYTYGRVWGGAIDVATASSLTVRQTTFSGHRLTSYQSTNSNEYRKGTYAEFAGTVISARGASVEITLEDVDITGGEITQEFGSPWNNYLEQPRRGQIWVQNGSTSSLDLLRVDFVDGFGDEGGAIYTRDNAGPLTITDCTFENCSVREAGGYEGYGGAIYRNGGELTVTNTSFVGCEADRRGGAIYAFGGGTRTITDCSFATCRVQNATEAWGGALCLVDSPTTAITGSTFTGNASESALDGQTTYAWGGGLFQAGGTLTMSDTTFQSNQAIGTGDGGNTRHAGGAAIYLDNLLADFTQVDFLDNVASAPGSGGTYARGGAIHAYANYSSFKRCRFEGNQATVAGGNDDGKGGAVFGRQSTRPSFYYCDFASNSARRGGAHFYESGCEPFLIGTSVRGNVASESGGGLHSESATPYILGCAFQANDAPDGGAIKSTGSGTSLPYVVDVDFCGNTVDDISGEILGGDGNVSQPACDGDCNGNGLPDIDEPEVPDVDGNGIPDTCETDCDEDGFPDLYQLSAGLSEDCNGNGVPDACDILDGTSSDADENGVPDECGGRGEPGGRSLLVPFDYASIQAAINDAVDGDEVVVAPGVYYEKINYGSRKIAIRSVGGSEVTYLDGNNQNGDLVRCDNVSGPGAILEGFTLWYAQGGYAVYTNNADLLVRDCELLFNFSSAAYLNGGTPVFERCRFEGNNAGSGGAAFLSDTNARFLECEFLENTASDGGALWGRYSNGVPVVVDCDFVGNVANTHGGAIRAQEGCRIDVDDCRFIDNRARLGGAVSMDSSDLTIDASTFESNTATDHGGAIYHYNCTSPMLADCVLAANSAEDFGGAIYHYNSFYPFMERCEIAACTADRGGGLYLETTDNGFFDSSLIEDCSARLGGGAYFLTSQPTIFGLDLVRCTSTETGAGFHADTSPFLLYQSRIGACVAGSSGGGLFSTSATAGSSPTFVDSELCANLPNDYDGFVNLDNVVENDACAFDCDDNGVVDTEDIANGDAEDCNGNFVPDSCELESGMVGDLNQNGIPDECEACFDGVVAPIEGAVQWAQNGHYYFVVNEEVTWSEARSAAEALGGHLATIGSAAENLFVKSLAPEIGLALGGYQPGGPEPAGGWAWVTGEPWTYTAWNSAEPNDSGGAEDYLQMIGSTGLWNDMGTTSAMPYVVEFPSGFFDDCNGNGLPDACDVESGTSTDCDGDGTPDECQAEQDADGDGTPDCIDGCPNDPDKTEAGDCGCGVSDADTDGDGTPDCTDECPDDPEKIAAGDCGCGVSDVDTDADGTPDCTDGCPNDADKIAPGDCGCGIAEQDTDGDGTPDCVDGCPSDPEKIDPGACGCGIPDLDSDGDGTPNCLDGCPGDSEKTEPGDCGCGVAEIDSDGDGTPDCVDGCPDDPEKSGPGACGCGVPDTDTDGDGTPDCIDVCPDTFDDQSDCDGDGVGDACDTDFADCNGNGVPDGCDIDGGDSADVDGDGVPDECEPDCNGNGLPDAYEIDQGLVGDCNLNAVPDSCDIEVGTVLDCNGNGVPDACDIDAGGSNDVDGNGIPDECKDDCNGNGIPDDYEVAEGLVPDCDGNGVPDACDVAAGVDVDCDGDGVPDICQILDDPAVDMDANGVLDLCEYDCNGNGISDLIDIATGDELDCNLDLVPDSCQTLDGSLEDRNNDQVPDDCQRIDWSGLAIETIAPQVYLGNPDIPTTALVYRIWAEFDDPAAELLMVFGDEIDPWTFSADGGFFQHVSGTGSSASQLCGDADLLGNLVHDSWITIGRECLEDNQLGRIGVPLDDFEAGGPLFVDDGAIFLEPGDAQALPDGTGRVLIAQLTTLTGTAPTGSVNLLGRNGDGTDWVAYGMVLPTPELVDCNQNGVHDAVDIATMSSDDCDGTGIPDECEDPTALLDCDFDGESDYCEIINGTSEDGNANQVPDDCECLGDSNGDGIVNVDDLVMLILSWGDIGPSTSDWNGDGMVDGADLSLVLAGYGGCI